MRLARNIYNTQKRQDKTRKMILLLLALCLFLESSEATQCACASQSVDVQTYHNRTDAKLGVLTSPSCLPYEGRQLSSPDGAIHALVDFHGRDAWVETSQVYIKNCNESFQCVCSIRDTALRTTANDSSKLLGNLNSHQCLAISDNSNNHNVDGWIQVDLSAGMTAWVKNTDVAFHDQCQGVAHFNADLQLPGCPRIITREEWGARPPRHTSLMPATPQFLVVHHGATRSCETRDECVRLVRSYQNYHMDGHGWDDIGYSFIIGEDGNVYEGRGWVREGAHTRHYNNVALGFCVMGNFMERLPNNRALTALRNLIDCTIANQKVRPDYTLLGHRDTNPSTLCPGDKLHDLLTGWPHFNFNNARYP